MGPENRLLLVGPHRLYLDCLALALGSAGRLAVVTAARASEAELRRLVASAPALVVVDVAMTQDGGTGWISQATRGPRPVKVMALGSAEEEQGVLDCIEAGATGAYLKDGPLESLVTSIERMLRGEPVCPPSLFPSLLSRLAANARGPAPTEGPGLTLRERDIYALLADGLSNKQIATRLNLSLHTVKNHVHRVPEKLQAEDRIEVVKRARVEHPDARHR